MFGLCKKNKYDALVERIEDMYKRVASDDYIDVFGIGDTDHCIEFIEGERRSHEFRMDAMQTKIDEQALYIHRMQLAYIATDDVIHSHWDEQYP